LRVVERRDAIAVQPGAEVDQSLGRIHDGCERVWGEQVDGE
jgi:hypothetical protein